MRVGKAPSQHSAGAVASPCYLRALFITGHTPSVVSACSQRENTGPSFLPLKLFGDSGSVLKNMYQQLFLPKKWVTKFITSVSFGSGQTRVHGGAGQNRILCPAPSEKRLRVEGWLIFPGPGYVIHGLCFPRVGCWAPGCPACPRSSASSRLRVSPFLEAAPSRPHTIRGTPLKSQPSLPGPSFPAQSSPALSADILEG